MENKILKIGMRVLLKKNFKIALVEKINPKYKTEFIVSYYDENNKLRYDSIIEDDVLPPADYQKIKERNNKINNIFRD